MEVASAVPFSRSRRPFRFPCRVPPTASATEEVVVQDADAPVHALVVEPVPAVRAAAAVRVGQLLSHELSVAPEPDIGSRRLPQRPCGPPLRLGRDTQRGRAVALRCRELFWGGCHPRRARTRRDDAAVTRKIGRPGPGSKRRIFHVVLAAVSMARIADLRMARRSLPGDALPQPRCRPGGAGKRRSRFAHRHLRCPPSCGVPPLQVRRS